MRAALPILCSLALVGCATTGGGGGRVDDPPLKMTMTATGLKEAEQELLKEQLCGVANVSDCQMQHEKGKTTYSFTYRGSLGGLRHQISQFPHPGLEALEARAALDYSGFDNLAPKIEPLEPVGDGVLTYKDVTFAVKVPDKDVKSVTFAGKKGAQEGEEWSKTLSLAEGKSEIPVVAVDGDGNERELYMTATVDTLPPEIEVTLSPKEDAEDVFIISGKVESGGRIFADGKELAVDLFGNWSVEKRWDPDKKTVTIRAVDEHGNEDEQTRDLKSGKVLD